MANFQSMIDCPVWREKQTKYPGFDLRILGGGLLFTGAGLYLLYATVFQNLVFAIRQGRMIPQWTNYIAVAVGLVVGVILVYNGINNRKCTDCSKPLEEHGVFLSFAHKEAIVEAAGASNTAPLRGIPLSDETGDYVKLTIEYCEECSKTGGISVSARENNCKSSLVLFMELNENALAGFLEYLHGLQA